MPRITDLTSASTVALTDTLVLVQSGTTKKCDVSQVKTLNASEITSGTLGTARLPVVPVASGGTGSTSATAALAALNAQPALTSASPLAISGGGTGATTAAAALSNLGGITSANVPSLVTAQLSAYTLLTTSAAFQNSAQVLALASTQIAAITPASIGAIATSAASGFATTTQIAGIANTSQLAALQNSAQVMALTTAQLNAISINSGIGLTGGGTIDQSRTIALQTSGVVSNVYGSNSTIPIISVDEFGRITGATSVGVSSTAGGTVTSVGATSSTLAISNSPILVSGALQIDLATTGVAAITAGSSAQSAVITVDAYGRVTALETQAISALSPTGVVAGSYGHPERVAQFTVTANGVITGATEASIAIPAAAVSGLAASATSDTTNAGNIITGTLSSDRISVLASSQISGISAAQVGAGLNSAQISAIASSALPASGVTPGSYGSSAQIAALTVDAKGRITTVSNIPAASGGGGSGEGMQFAVVRHNTQVTPASAGTVNLSAWSSGATTINFSATPAFTLVPGMVINATGLNTIAIRTVNSPTQVVLASGATAAGGAASNITVQNSTATTLTVTAGALPAYDGRTIQLNDVVYLTGQGVSTTPTAQNGPWTVTTLGATGVSAVFTRPSWFTGALSGPRSVGITGGTNNYGFTFSISGNIASSTSYTVGVDPLLFVEIATRSTIVTVSGTSPFTTKQTFAANSVSVNPISFSTAASQTLLATPVVGAIEWDTQQMYLTGTTAVAGTTRNPVATAMVPINPQTGTAYTITNITTGSDAGKLITASNTSPITITIPASATANSNFSIGTQILVMQINSGGVTISPAVGVTLQGRNGLKTAGAYAVISLLKIAADTWVIAGDATV